MSDVGFFLDQETNSFIVSVLPQYLHFIIILCLSMISIVALISSSLFVTQFKFGQLKIPTMESGSCIFRFSTNLYSLIILMVACGAINASLLVSFFSKNLFSTLIISFFSCLLLGTFKATVMTFPSLPVILSVRKTSIARPDSI